MLLRERPQALHAVRAELAYSIQVYIIIRKAPLSMEVFRWIGFVGLDVNTIGDAIKYFVKREQTASHCEAYQQYGVLGLRLPAGRAG